MAMTGQQGQTSIACYSLDDFGFRVDLLNAPLAQHDGVWRPAIDLRALEQVLAYHVPLKPGPLCGHEVRFLRRQCGFSLAALAARLGVTKQCVSKWEKTGERETNMGGAAEKLFRLIVLDHKGVAAEIFKKSFELLFEPPQAPPRPYAIDATQIARWGGGPHEAL